MGFWSGCWASVKAISINVNQKTGVNKNAKGLDMMANCWKTCLIFSSPPQHTSKVNRDFSLSSFPFIQHPNTHQYKWSTERSHQYKWSTERSHQRKRFFSTRDKSSGTVRFSFPSLIWCHLLFFTHSSLACRLPRCQERVVMGRVTCPGAGSVRERPEQRLSSSRQHGLPIYQLNELGLHGVANNSLTAAPSSLQLGRHVTRQTRL